METENIIIVSVLGGAIALLGVVVLVLVLQVSRLRRSVAELTAGRVRVQKLRMSREENHAFQNPALAPDEELTKRGFSMYAPDDRERDRDVESGRSRERQTGGLVDDIAREIEMRQQRQANAPPFLLQSIEENKRMRSSTGNPIARGRQSETNANFIY